MDKIFLIIGSVGEYDDAREWNVRAFANKTDADNFVVILKEQMKRFFEAVDGCGICVVPDLAGEMIDGEIVAVWSRDVEYVVSEVPFGMLVK